MEKRMGLQPQTCAVGVGACQAGNGRPQDPLTVQAVLRHTILWLHCRAPRFLSLPLSANPSSLLDTGNSEHGQHHLRRSFQASEALEAKLGVLDTIASA